ncbi:hypothetical protein PRZ48_000336 [Zasmidium cellare]|uniref:Uncharacterized protein n=1 Tax=Zasmidium cellare TaxID=395010 RepID=A0ABR0EY66_ZASCE|nr:hypothetical protein PRZ48_000336 [Zasmidium cellare]
MPSVAVAAAAAAAAAAAGTAAGASGTDTSTSTDYNSPAFIGGISGAVGGVAFLIILSCIIHYWRRRRNPQPRDRALPIDEHAMDGWKEFFKLLGNSFVDLVTAPYRLVSNRCRGRRRQRNNPNQNNDVGGDAPVDGNSSEHMEMENINSPRPKSNDMERQAPTNDDGLVHDEQQENNNQARRSFWDRLKPFKNRNQDTRGPEPDPSQLAAPFRQPRGERSFGHSARPN